MAYYCRDCGYQSKRRINSAQCPACDSYAIVTKTKHGDKEQQSPRQRRARIGVLVVLWAYLITEIYFKLYG